MKLLPVSAEDVVSEEKEEKEALMNFEPEEEEAVSSCSKIYDKYSVWRICEAVAARMVHVCRRWILRQIMQKRLLMIWN